MELRKNPPRAHRPEPQRRGAQGHFLPISRPCRRPLLFHELVQGRGFVILDWLSPSSSPAGEAAGAPPSFLLWLVRPPRCSERRLWVRSAHLPGSCPQPALGPEMPRRSPFPDTHTHSMPGKQGANASPLASRWDDCGAVHAPDTPHLHPRPQTLGTGKG